MLIPIEGRVAPSAGGQRADGFPAPRCAGLSAANGAIGERKRGGAEIGKRSLDLFAAVTLVLLLAPLALAVAVAILLVEGRPLIFWQRRVGRWGEVFWCPKFRSMRAVPESASRPPLKTRDDPRLTAIGRVIRRSSLDELPQLLCVLSGEMSMVGPRPALPEEVEHYPAPALRRLEVKPGLTCFWQVGGRSELSFARQVELDLRYVEERSFGLDLRLLLRTIPAVLSGRGAY
jgi:lipopolysaccharide/colanic/teichoic acid biosynthesis glycosyltransferase